LRERIVIDHPFRQRIIHRNRGQLCGQPCGPRPRTQHWRAADWIAEVLSTNKPFDINELRRTSTLRGGIYPGSANTGAAVQLSGRASLGFARG
jgi:hypothetical protein